MYAWCMGLDMPPWVVSCLVTPNACVCMSLYICVCSTHTPMPHVYIYVYEFVYMCMYLFLYMCVRGVWTHGLSRVSPLRTPTGWCGHSARWPRCRHPNPSPMICIRCPTPCSPYPFPYNLLKHVHFTTLTPHSSYTHNTHSPTLHPPTHAPSPTA